MIPNTTVNVPISIKNPDSESLVRKLPIDISVSETDISSSLYYDEESSKLYENQIKLNYNKTEIVLLDDETSEKFDTYYTPLYTEKILYDEWKKRINKQFEELEL